MPKSSYIEPVRFKQIPIYDENGNLSEVVTPKFSFDGIDENTIDVSLPLDLTDPVNLASVSASANDLVTPVDVDVMQATDVVKNFINNSKNK